ncbi:MAG: LacI family transcriptional regulator [Phycisphaerae bacterium]|nr:LacI family transcriptional regulator [Phycisphaerae bacterium]
MAVTLADIARRAGVSKTAVSRVVNHSRGTAGISASKRAEILRVAQDMGYLPNAASRATRQGRFNRIAGVVVQYGSDGSGYFPNTGFLDPAADHLAEHGYSLVLEPLHLDLLDDAFREPPRIFSELAVDGILGLPAGGVVPATVDEHLARLGAPVVWMNRDQAEHPHSVMSDEEANARMLVRHLIDLGHRRIGYIAFESPNYVLSRRARGVLGELEAAGLDTSGVLIGPRASCMVGLAEALLVPRLRVTAAIGQHRGAYDALSHTALRLGIRVPEELSLAYFASPWQVVLSDYRPTTVEVAEGQMAVRAAARLLALVSGEEISEPEPPIAGTLRPGWTTARPGSAWAEGVRRCRHEEGVCLYADRTAHWRPSVGP